MKDDGYWIKLVLKKLKNMMLAGRLGLEDGVRYEYDWNALKNLDENIELVRQEDRALLYLDQIKVIEADRLANEYRSQQLKRLREEGEGVWSDWDEVDPAYREYEWEVEIYGVYPEKFKEEFEKVGLKDTGTMLVETGKPTPLSPIEEHIGNFTAYEDGTVRYQDKLINSFKPQERHLVHALIIRKGALLTRNQIKDALWDADDEDNFAAKPTTTEPMITKRIGSIVSGINKLLYSHGDKKHIVCGGETSYKFVA